MTRKVPLFDADGNALLDERERPREADLELNGGQLLWFVGASCSCWACGI
ncbi:MAG UNVERIFIED_CONTAM: hypothetical protein LVT10_23105 [Anaerolineae bacterium]